MTANQDIVGGDMTNRILEGLEDSFGGGKDFFEILDMLPLNILVFTVDGTAVFVNQKYCESYRNIDPQKLIGIYNFLQDPVLARAYKIEEFFRRVFAGDVLTINCARIDLEKMPLRFVKSDAEASASRIDRISGFPVYDQDKKIKYVVFTSHATTVFEGEEKIVKAKEYMYENWSEDFSLDAVAKSCGFNKYYFSHFFKKQTGYTPYEYYKNLKIDKLKEMLLSPKMSIAEAFRECGLDYKGQYAKFFKEIVGMTPSEYRKKVLQNK